MLKVFKKSFSAHPIAKEGSVEDQKEVRIFWFYLFGSHDVFWIFIIVNCLEPNAFILL